MWNVALHCCYVMNNKHLIYSMHQPRSAQQKEQGGISLKYSHLDLRDCLRFEQTSSDRSILLDDD